MTAHDDRDPVRRPVAGLVVAAATFVVLAVALVGLPKEGAHLPAVARLAMRAALPAWHSTEPVNVVVYGIRGFDTFGETFLLLAAVVSVVLLTRRREPRGERSGEEQAARREQSGTGAGNGGGQTTARRAESEEQDDSGETRTPDDERVGTLTVERAESMTVVVRGAARVAAPILAVAGIYLCAWGYAPGGGFPAGAVLLGVVVLLYAALGRPAVARATDAGLVELLELVGAIAILALAVVGLATKGSFLANWLPLAPEQTIRSGGLVQAFSVSELLEVATGLILVVFALIDMRHDWAAHDDQDGER